MTYDKSVFVLPHFHGVSIAVNSDITIFNIAEVLVSLLSGPCETKQYGISLSV